MLTAIVAITLLTMAGAHDGCSEPEIRLAAATSIPRDWPRMALETPLLQANAVAGLTNELAETGGVLTPPEGGRLIIVEPPTTGPNSMETTPDLAPRVDSNEQIPVNAK